MNFENDEIKDTVKYLRLSFSDEKLPVFKESKAKEIYFYGEKNDYPEKLLEMYNRSPKHNAIVTKKAKFICGKETIIEGYPQLVTNWNKYDSIHQFKNKIELDKRLFGGFACEVIYDNAGKPTYYHINFAKIRTLDHSCYQYWKDGSKTKAADIIYYDAYDPKNLVKENGLYKKQILYVRTYRADLGVYPLPEYIGASAYIQIDTRIANFHLNNIANGFSGGTLIQLFKGEPTPEEARKTKKAFQAGYSGDDGTDTGGFILQFNEPNETPAEITPLAANDLDQRFLQLNNHVQQEIFVGHGITSPMLFGVRVEGQLGGRNELKEAYEIYYRDVIEPEQMEMDSFLTSLLQDKGINAQVKTVKSEPIAQDWVALFQAGLVDKPTAQEGLGLPVEEVPQLDATQKLSNSINALSPLVANKVLNELSQNEVRSLAGLPPVVGGDSKSEPTVQFSRTLNEDEDLLIYAQFGELETDYVQLDFADINENELKVLAAAKDSTSVEEIAKITRLKTLEVEKILKQLEDSNKIKLGGKAVSITKAGKDIIDKSGGDKLVVRYRYAVSPEAAPLKTQSRPFCQKLMDLGRVYSREDIDTMSAALDYDVWKLRGGWYHNPLTGVNIPHCRHEWRQVILRKK